MAIVLRRVIGYSINTAHFSTQVRVKYEVKELSAIKSPDLLVR